MSHWENTGKSDEWYTPKLVFDALNERFDLDVASPKGSKTFVPADHFITENSLKEPWQGFVWMNPPFGGRNGLKPWLDRFFDHGNGIALVPDRTSAPWFQAAWKSADLALFTPKLRFHRPDGSIGASPSNGTTLFAAGERAEQALMRAAKLGLGIIAKPIEMPRSKFEERFVIANERFRVILGTSGGRFSEMSEEESMEIVRFAAKRAS